MMQNLDNMAKFHGNIYIKEGFICDICKELKHKQDYAVGMCNDCYIKRTRGLENTPFGE